MAYSERFPTRLNPLAERTCFSQVDVWAQVLDDFGHLKFTELTNYFVLRHTPPGEPRGPPRDLTIPFQKSYYEALRDDIVKYQDPTHRNAMKVAKRMWMRAVHARDIETLRVLFPLFSSPAAALSQVAAECETLELLVAKTGSRQGVLSRRR